MKKLIMAIMAIGYAISAQAAAVIWTTGEFTDRHGDPVGVFLESNTDFTIVVSFLFWDTTLNSGAGGWVSFVPVGGTLTSSATDMFTLDLRGKAGTDSDPGGFANSAKYQVSWTVTGPEPLWIAEGSREFTTVGTGNHTLAPLTVNWVQVPEPATMALVGIGIVALGLRRRRK